MRSLASRPGACIPRNPGRRIRNPSDGSAPGSCFHHAPCEFVRAVSHLGLSKARYPAGMAAPVADQDGLAVRFPGLPSNGGGVGRAASAVARIDGRRCRDPTARRPASQNSARGTRVPVDGRHRSRCRDNLTSAGSPWSSRTTKSTDSAWATSVRSDVGEDPHVPCTRCTSGEDPHVRPGADRPYRLPGRSRRVHRRTGRSARPPSSSLRIGNPLVIAAHRDYRPVSSAITGSSWPSASRRTV